MRERSQIPSATGGRCSGIALRTWPLLACLVWFSAMFVQGETIVLKSGQSGTGKSFRREGNTLRFQMEVRGPDGKMALAERGVGLADIERVEGEMPEVLKKGPAQLAAGKAASLVPELAAAVKSTEALGELPGSWWPRLVGLQAGALLAAGKDSEAVAVAGALVTSANPVLANEGKALQAVAAARKGDSSGAELLTSPLWKERDKLSPPALAAMSVARGLVFLSKKDFAQALKSFLELPVFLPDETALSGVAQLGAAEAYFGLEDYDRAIATLEELVKAQPAAPDSAKAKTLLPAWQQRRTAANEARVRGMP